MGTLAYMNRRGDQKVMWNAEVKAEVDAARRTFDDLTAKGYLAYAVDPADGSKGKQIREFDPDAQKIILAAPLAGG